MRASRFLDVVQSLLEAPLDADLLALQPGLAVCALADGTVAMVLDAEGARLAVLEETLAEFLRRARGTGAKLVIIGGDGRHRDLLARMQPTVMVGRAIQAFALDDEVGVWAGARSRVDSPLGRALATVHARAQPRDVDVAALLERIHVPSPEDRSRAEAAHAFVEGTRTGQAPLTLALIGIIAVVFGLEWLWGGTEAIPTLVRMGANTDATRTGEPWRLLSSAWLHAGPLHVLVNGYVLYSLGGFLERLLGAPRMLVLYVLAGAAGGLASAWFSEAALSVGASGAIWGLLGASVALAWRPAGLIPDAVLPTVRRNAIVNVVINVAVSFIPAVDAMAHLGGGVMGAALVMSGIVTRGVTLQPRAFPRAWGAAAVVAGALLLAAPVVAIIHGRPWALFDTAVHTVALGDGASMQAPVALGLRAVDDDGRRTEAVLGDPLRDVGGITVVIERHGEVLPSIAELDAAFAEFRAEPMAAPEGGEAVGARTFTEGPGYRGFAERFRFDNGLELRVEFQIHMAATVRIESIHWAQWPEAGAALEAAAASLSITPR